MARKTEERRETLRTTLIDLAEAQIRAEGIGTLRARELATKAGCSVGAIYNVFPDLTALGIAVNARTFDMMATVIRTHLEQAQATDPTDQLVALSLGYFSFAEQNTHAWRALFDIDLTDDAPAPDWYRARMEAMFGVILDPVATLFPDQSETEQRLMARALFSSVHGIVLLGLDNAHAGVPRDQIKTMISMVLHRLR